MREINQHNIKYWVSDEVYTEFKPQWFESPQSKNLTESNKYSAGRHAIKRITCSNMDMILRHYYRGGMPARFSKDRFLFFGFRHTRPYREFSLLNLMTNAQLPVPKPVAAKCIRVGASYQADILMHEISDAITLVETLKKSELTENTWQKIGNTIAKFHRFGIHHVDLNAHNILIDNNENIYLIDFDRCKFRPYQRRWAQSGLNRLQRSLDKEQSKNVMLNYSREMFLQLSKAYQASV